MNLCLNYPSTYTNLKIGNRRGEVRRLRRTQIFFYRTLRRTGVGNPNSLHVNNLWFDPATILSFAGFPAPFPLGTVYVDTSTNNTLRMV